MQMRRDSMGMPVELIVPGAPQEVLEAVFAYFNAVDARFSPYKRDSELAKINRGEAIKLSSEMCEVLALAQQTAVETGGYFDIRVPAERLPAHQGRLDPSGLVKGWAIRNAARLLESQGYGSYFLNVGGDIASCGTDEHGKEWSVGVRNPFNHNEVVKVVVPRGRGIATSGTYARGQHIYNPHAPQQIFEKVVSLTVVGPDVYEADRFATAAFAMGEAGIAFIEALPGFEGYSIDARGVATMTSNFEKLAC